MRYILIVSLLLVGCGELHPRKYADQSQRAYEGPGLLTGPEGKFILLGPDETPNQ